MKEGTGKCCVCNTKFYNPQFFILAAFIARNSLMFIYFTAVLSCADSLLLFLIVDFNSS